MADISSHIIKAPRIEEMPPVINSLLARTNGAVRSFLFPSLQVVNKPYRTVLEWESGYTVIICNYCNGRDLQHEVNCRERCDSKTLRRKFKPIRRVITYQMYAEVDEKGTVILP